MAVIVIIIISHLVVSTNVKNNNYELVFCNQKMFLVS